MEIKPLKKADHKKAINFCLKGMHMYKYADTKFALNAYGKYFWYLEYTEATEILAAYEGDRLLGVLLADMKGEKKPYRSITKSIYIQIINFVQKYFYKGAKTIYVDSNNAMYEAYSKVHEPDGEIRLLAADPDSKVRGIGTFLINELAKRKAGKEIFLYTDEDCTYQFYDHRGFECVGENDVEIDFTPKVKIKCFLYRKHF